jgi:hypothetical protein
MTRAVLVLTALAAVPAFAAEEAGRDIFNGKDLAGWVVEGAADAKEKDKDGKPLPNWTVKDGKLCLAGNGYGFLRFDEKVADFALHVEYRMPNPDPKKAGNSGIGIRTPPYDPAKSGATRPSAAAYEVQILDEPGKEPHKSGNASLYKHVAPSRNALKPAPEWNTIDIECVGPRIRISVNGEQVIDVDQTTVPEIKDKPLSGYVSLQCHGTPVEFRSVRLRHIKK